jgi:SAM-dependent MidA family methyltransferase
MFSASRGESLSAQLAQRLHAEIAAAGGWLPFDRFMAIALYEPGLGYYARGSRIFGAMPESGSDFITGPEMTPLFGRALARQVEQALDRAEADQVFEFGAGSGALAAQLLEALGNRVAGYSIIELSGPLRQRQAERLKPFGDRVRWLDAWPADVRGVIVGNEVLDAMPVQLLAWDGHRWHERGVTCKAGGTLAWADRATALRPPGDVTASRFVPGTVTEIHSQAEGFIRSLAARLQRGAAFFIDYGFGEAEYYHPQRTGGTLMCHRGHRSDTDPLVDVGDKDITAHINFSGIALAGQDAGLNVLGYTSQAHFLINCGLLEFLDRPANADMAARAAVNRLLGEHEMGELFKVIGFGRGIRLDDAIGFSHGDRSHTL